MRHNAVRKLVRNSLMNLMQRRDAYATRATISALSFVIHITLDAGLVVVLGDCPMALLISCKSE
jgi:hypothetical protein